MPQQGYSLWIIRQYHLHATPQRRHTRDHNRSKRSTSLIESPYPHPHTCIDTPHKHIRSYPPHTHLGHTPTHPHTQHTHAYFLIHPRRRTGWECYIIIIQATSLMCAYSDWLTMISCQFLLQLRHTNATGVRGGPPSPTGYERAESSVFTEDT